MAHVSLPSYKLGWYVMYYTPFLAVDISFRFGFEIFFILHVMSLSLSLSLSHTHARARALAHFHFDGTFLHVCFQNVSIIHHTQFYGKFSASYNKTSYFYFEYMGV